MLSCPLRVPCCNVRYEYRVVMSVTSFVLWYLLRVPHENNARFVFTSSFCVDFPRLVSLSCTFVLLSLRYSLTFTKAAYLVFFMYAWLRIMVPDTFCAAFFCCFFSSYGNHILPFSLGCTFVVLSLRYSLTFINIYDIYIYFIIINYFVIGGWSFFFSCLGCLGWSWSSADSFVFLTVTSVSLQKQYFFNYM